MSGPLIRRFGVRVFRSAVLLVASSLVAFLACEWLPGDSFTDLRLDPAIAASAIDALRHETDADRSLPSRYVSWIGAVARGDFGYSRTYRLPISRLIAGRLGNTVRLALTGLALSWLTAVPLGVWAAARRNRLDGRAVTLATNIFLGLPDLVIATLMLAFAGLTGLFAMRGGLVLPAIVIVLSATPTLVRHVRSGVLDVLSAPYILAAQSRGVPRHRILFRSALRAAAAPLAPLLGLSLAAFFSTAMIVEVVLGWPGVGPLLVDAVLSRDTPLVLAGVIASSILLLAGNTVGDLLLTLCDPRTEAA